MKRNLCILFFQLLAFTGWNQNPWSLEQCLDSALINNLGLKQVNLEVENAQLGVQQAQFNFTPDVNGYAGQSYSAGRNLDPISNTFTQTNRQNSNFSLSGNLVLFNGMARYYALKKNELMVENQFYNRIVMIRNLKMEIITSYLQALLSYELSKIAKGHLQYTQAEYDKMLAFVEVEIKSSKDLLAIETQRAKDELVLLRAQNDFKLANLKLNQLMQLENQTTFHVDTSYNFLFTDTSVFIQVNNLPEIMQKERVIEQAEYDVKMASAAYFPSLSVRAGLGSGYSDSYFLTDPTSGLSYIPDFQSQLTQNMYQNLTFTLTVPIYNKYQTKINQAQNEIEVKKAELERDQLVLEIRATISNLRFDLENSQLELNSAMKLLELAKLDFERAEEQSKAGVINYIILLDKKDRLFAAQSNVIQSKYNYYFKGKLLQLYNE